VVQVTTPRGVQSVADTFPIKELKNRSASSHGGMDAALFMRDCAGTDRSKS
jgi:hypothetical protein